MLFGRRSVHNASFLCCINAYAFISIRGHYAFRHYFFYSFNLYVCFIFISALQFCLIFISRFAYYKYSRHTHACILIRGKRIKIKYIHDWTDRMCRFSNIYTYFDFIFQNLKFYTSNTKKKSIRIQKYSSNNFLIDYYDIDLNSKCKHCI